MMAIGCGLLVLIVSAMGQYDEYEIAPTVHDYSEGYSDDVSGSWTDDVVTETVAAQTDAADTGEFIVEMDVSVAVGNQLLFTSTTLTVDTVAAIVVKLPGSESTALASENCLREDVTQSPPPPPHSDLCRWELIDACHDYSVVVQVQFRNESVVDIYRHLKAHPAPGAPRNVQMEEAEDDVDRLFVTWEEPEEAACLQHYQVSLLAMDYTSSVHWQTDTNNTSVVLKVNPCIDYLVEVASVALVAADSQDNVAAAQTYIGQKRVELLSALSFNDTCLMVEWRTASEYQHRPCIIKFFTIFLHHESTLMIEKTIDSSERTQMICHLQTDTTYEISIRIVTEDGLESQQSNVINGTTHSGHPKYYRTTIGLIIAMVFTVLMLIAAVVSLVFYMKWQSIKWRLLSNRPSLGLKLRRLTRISHCIRVSNLDPIVRRLSQDTFRLEFADLQTLSQSHRYTKNAAMQTENLNKNRYQDILPFDHSRVQLTTRSIAAQPASDYINASFIEGFNGPFEYIACQGPLPSTLADFWQMIWEQRVVIVVMVTSLEERGKKKCAQYWPPLNESMTYGDVVVTNSHETQLGHYTSRSLQIHSESMEAELRVVKHIHFGEWPDFGCPNSLELVVRLAELVRIEIAGSSLPIPAPTLVHCSAGVGRTGTFITIDWLMQQAAVAKDIDVFATVAKLRKYRDCMVQSEEQYELIYKCVSHFTTTRLFPSTISATQDSTDGEVLLSSDV